MNLRHQEQTGHRLDWRGPQLAALDERPEGLARDVRWTRMTRLDRYVLAAACAIDQAAGGALRSGGPRAAAVVQVNWAALDGARSCLERIARHHGGMARDFAQMGGTSTCHYLATCLGIKGYATVLFDDSTGQAADTLTDDVAALPYLDLLCRISVRLRLDVGNRLMGALAPVTEEVSAHLTRIAPRETD
ncbi:hypothetical protein [Streptomyces sp. NPDC096013]|uniref:hypothetical protein n=1 Tax=Streptomyces sp. NPDC096013 TaxID=3366069 RepID=UPI00382E390A